MFLTARGKVQVSGDCDGGGGGARARVGSGTERAATRASCWLFVVGGADSGGGGEEDALRSAEVKVVLPGLGWR